MPSLIRIYQGGDEIGKFEPRSREDEEAAEVETDVCNWYLDAKNDLFSHVSSTLRDALLLKNGYMVSYWNKRYDTMTETYEGQSDEEAAMLASDPEVEVLEHSEEIDPVTGQTLHSMKVEAKRCEEYPAVESVPPDEMIVSRRHRWTSLLDADFVQWRRRVSIGQLRSEGFKVSDDEPSYDDLTQEATTRARFQENDVSEDNTPDPSRRIVQFKDTYMRIDLRGKGTPQLWRIAYCSGSKKPTLLEEADIIPFAAFSPIIYPHSHVGSSIYDLINDIGLIKTQLTREYLDSLYLATRPRVGVDINRATNLDDIMVSRPGGVIRFDGDPNSAMSVVMSPDIGPAALAGLEYLESINERRTGVTRYSAGLDANTLNKTATGVQAIQSAANQRIELIARTLASGFKDLFLIVHALALKHSTKPIQLKLKNEWTVVNPREWKKRTDFSISVGLGTGTPESQIQKLQLMGPGMQMAAQMGLAGPEEWYNFLAESWKAAGYKIPDRFLHEPQKQPKMGQDGQPEVGPDGQPVMEAVAPPPPKDPAVQVAEIRAQTDMQAAQIEAQNDVQKFHAEQQISAQRLQGEQALQQQNDQRQAELDERKLVMEAQKMQMEHALEMERMNREYQFKMLELEKTLEMKERVAISAAHMQAESAKEVAKSKPNGARRDA